MISASGGTFSGTTSGTDPLAPSCGSTGSSGAKVFQWTPAVSGVATLQTCGPVGTTNYDTVLSLRATACRTGSQLACNDDFCACASGCAANNASKITPTVTAGQTYFAIVDGAAGRTGNFTLTVTPPTVATTTTTGAGTTTTTLASWAQRFGGSGTDIGYGVARDAGGNVVFAGDFHGSVSFGGGTLTSASGVSVVVAKYTPSGAHLWSKSVAGPGGSVVQAAAVDGNGDVLVTGSFNGTVNFGASPVAATSSNNTDLFVAKYAAANGTLLWAHTYGDIANSGSGAAVNCSGNGVTVDTRSNCDGAGGTNCVLLTGSFQGVVNFGGSNLSDSSLTTDVFVAKFNAAGVHQWSKSFPNSALDIGKAIATDSSGNVALAGYYTGRVNFSGGSVSSGLPIGNNGQSCGFAAEFTSSGTYTWSRGFCDTAVSAVSVLGNGVACDSSGNVVITGQFGNTVDFGTGIQTSSGSRDVFLAKYAGNGAPTWVHHYGSVTPNAGGTATADAITIDSGNNIAIVGVFSNTSVGTGVNFGGGALVSVGAGDGFVAQYMSGGSFTWAKRYGGTAGDEGRAVAVDGSGNVFVTGNFVLTADFGTQTLVSNASSTDIFLIKLTSAGGL